MWSGMITHRGTGRYLSRKVFYFRRNKKNHLFPKSCEMAGCRMNPGCDSLKNRRPAARFAVMYSDQAPLPNEVRPFKILSIKRVHEVSGHFLSSVLDRNKGKQQLIFYKISCNNCNDPVIFVTRSTRIGHNAQACSYACILQSICQNERFPPIRESASGTFGIFGKVLEKRKSQ